MLLSVSEDDWTQVEASTDLQISNEGPQRMRVAQQATKPTDPLAGRLLSTYAENYAVVFVGAGNPVWLRGFGGYTSAGVEVV